MHTINLEQNSTKATHWISDLGWLLLSFLLSFGLFLGSRPLTVPDEARYAEIPREMLALGDYVTPHLDYVKYFEKPPLFYWLQAASLHFFGINEWAARIPNALLAIGGCLLVYSAGRRLFDRRTGILSSWILATSVLYFTLGHTVTLDLTLSIFLAASLFSFLIAIQSPTGNLRRLGCYLAYATAALAVLSKGLVGIMFPGLIIVSWLALTKEWRLLKSIYLPSGIILFLVIALPWHILVQQRNPEFFQFYFIDQQFSRYLTLSAHRYQPAWFFIPVLLLGLFPWVIFLGQTIRYHLSLRFSNSLEYKRSLFLLLWAGWIFVFFSLSHSKLVPYILPIFLPLAVLIGRYLAVYWNTPIKGIKWAYLTLPIVLMILTIIGFILLPYFALPAAGQALFYVGWISGIWCLGSLVSAWLYFRKQQFATLAFICLILTSLLAYWVALHSVTTFDNRSIKTLALAVKPLLTPIAEVVAYEHYYQDLPFYLQRRVTIVDWQNELTFGMHHQNVSDWMINNATFWQRWQQSNPIYMITDWHTYQTLQVHSSWHLYLLASTATNVLVANHPPVTKP